MRPLEEAAGCSWQPGLQAAFGGDLERARWEAYALGPLVPWEALSAP